MSAETASRPRVGIPYRTQKEELAGDRSRYDAYANAVIAAQGDAVEISLGLSRADLRRLAATLDAFVLPGSPADVDPGLFGAPRHSKCGAPDAARERTDFALLEHAFTDGKPVLAICYGNQTLNVFQGGSLVQDIGSEIGSAIQHDWAGRADGAPEPFHSAQIEPRSRLASIASGSDIRVNSSHHQSILKPGRDLEVVARAADGVVEGVEWTGDGNWVVGVQWHPERMVDSNALARALFYGLVAASRKVPARAS
jgi:putative glutamine amidotransferase